MSSESFACDLTALDADQRSRRARLAEILRAKAIRVVERPDGYVVHLGHDQELARLAEELIQLEQKCCPFLNLRLGQDETSDGTVLEITGDVATKVFIAAEIGVSG